MKRTFSSNIKGRVKNFGLNKTTPLVPLVEAISNSLQAIDEKRISNKSFTEGKIIITIIRDSQTKDSQVQDITAIESFEIYDNGIGFDKTNMESFLESDSTYKANLGGKGVGRFSWLNAFNSVSVESVFEEQNKFYKRNFDFTLNNNEIDDEPYGLDINKENRTYSLVKLTEYKKEYQVNVPLQAQDIAILIIQEFIVYFLDEKCPQININDSCNKLNLNNIFKEKFKSEENINNFQINDDEFKLLNIKITDNKFNGNRLYLCADNRLVENINLENHISNLDNSFFSKNNFSYLGILASKYLDEKVEANRLSFNMPKDTSTLDKSLSAEEILNESCNQIERYLTDYLNPISEEKQHRINEYITQKAPQYKFLFKYMADEINKTIKPNDSDEKIGDVLFDIKRKFEKKAKKEQTELIKKIDNDKISFEEYERQFIEQNRKIIDVNDSVLAEYVAHRKVVINLLEKGLRRQDDEKFNKESYLHDLIYPMKATSDDINYESHNLWLIDEKLSYCQYIASDIPLNTKDRPDILIADNPIAMSDRKNDGNAFDAIIIFELKRPMRNDYTDIENPIRQLRNYLRKFRENEITDQNGRYINVSGSTKYYLYAICDVSPKFKKYIEGEGFTETPDGLGFYWFNPIQNAYYEILSYDKILNDANKRNRILFDKLGIK